MPAISVVNAVATRFAHGPLLQKRVYFYEMFELLKSDRFALRPYH